MILPAHFLLTFQPMRIRAQQIKDAMSLFDAKLIADDASTPARSTYRYLLYRAPPDATQDQVRDALVSAGCTEPQHNLFKPEILLVEVYWTTSEEALARAKSKLQKVE